MFNEAFQLTALNNSGMTPNGFTFLEYDKSGYRLYTILSSQFLMLVYIDFHDAGTITDETTGAVFHAQPFPPFIREIIEEGGLINRTKKVLGK